MLKVFTTQLLGIMQQITKKEEEVIEDASRMLAQTILSNGTIFFYGKGVLHSVALEAILGKNTLTNADFLVKDHRIQEVHAQDTVVLVTDKQDDANTLVLIDQLSDIGCQIIGIAPIDNERQRSDFANRVDFYIELLGENSIVPLTDDKKIGQPLTLTALYIYMALYLTTMDILDDFLQ